MLQLASISSLKFGWKIWWKSYLGYNGKVLHTAVEDVALVYASVDLASLSNVSCNYMRFMPFVPSDL